MMRSIALAWVLLALIGFTAQATLTSTFEVTSEDATIAFYSYLKEPKLEDSGYTKGLKTGAFDYLVMSPNTKSKAHVVDKITYFYGETDEDGKMIDVDNASVIHTHIVDFLGEKGISEFYGKGFFKNNRAVSAWKKIRYEDVSDYMLGPSYMSNYIKSDAKLWMDSKKGLDYDLKYHADIGNGLIEIKDSSAWTNKSISRRIDWEQEALLKGKILNVTNNLKDFDEFFPGAGDEEWLPCCFSERGSAPLYTDEIWPSQDTRYVLSCQCPGKISDSENISYESPNYKTTQGSSANRGGTDKTKQGPAIQATKDLLAFETTSDGNLLITYGITVKNVGGTKLQNAKAVDILPEKMTYTDAETRTAIENTRETVRFEQEDYAVTQSPKTDGTTEVKWDLGELTINEIVKIKLKVKAKLGADPYKNKAEAEGDFMGTVYTGHAEQVDNSLGLEDIFFE
jgi:hypothetical protein